MDKLDKLLQFVCIVGITLVTSLEFFAHRRNLASLFYWHYFEKYDLGELASLSFSRESSTGYSDKLQTISDHHLQTIDVTRMSLSKISLLF